MNESTVGLSCRGCCHTAVAHAKALPVSKAIIYAILDLSKGNWEGCISNTREHCRIDKLNPLVAQHRAVGVGRWGGKHVPTTEGFTGSGDWIWGFPPRQSPWGCSRDRICPSHTAISWTSMNKVAKACSCLPIAVA